MRKIFDGIPCPVCHSTETVKLGSRIVLGGRRIKRRLCQHCGKVFSIKD